MPGNMSNSPDFSENGKFSGRRIMKAPEKSNFSHTCSMLSQYLKKKGSFGDLSLGMTCNLEGKGKPETFCQTATTMNLLPKIEISGELSEVSNRNSAASQNVKFMDLFPQNAGSCPSGPVEEVPKRADSRPVKTEPEIAQMTMFYAGKVFVFNDFPAEKAKEVMLLASKASTKNNGTSAFSGNDQPNSGSTFAASTPNIMANSGNNSVIVANSSNNSTQERLQRPPQTSVSDLPIARKASLHRFLEKRKDRITAKAPYQVNNPAASSSKPEEGNSWLGLASDSSSQL